MRPAQTVDYTNASQGSDLYTFVTEASTLCLPPGQFPQQLKTALGNRQPFVRVSRHREWHFVRYRQSMGCLDLLVFNT